VNVALFFSLVAVICYAALVWIAVRRGLRVRVNQLFALYLGTMVLNELISNNAAAALAFPFCIESARLLGVHERPFILGITLAASYAFASPIGYQTHMMVFGPGGYRFADFLRVGIPLNLLMCAAAVVLIPWIWPFAGP